MKVMPEGFPQVRKIIDDDAGSGENFKLTLRFHRFSSKIFYDPFWEWWDNRLGTLVVDNDVYELPRHVLFGGSRDLKVYDFFNSAMRRLPKAIWDSLEPQFEDESFFYLVKKVINEKPYSNIHITHQESTDMKIREILDRLSWKNSDE